MLTNNKFYRGLTITLVALFVASVVITALAFAAPQPALAWTHCESYGCTNTVCNTKCTDHIFYVYKYKLWLCYTDGGGYQAVRTCTCKEAVGDC